MRILHREQQPDQTVEIFEETPARICEDLLWSSTLLEAQNWRIMSHFIAACGRAFIELSQTIADHQRSSQVSYRESQQCGQPTSHDGMSPYSPAIFIVAMELI